MTKNSELIKVTLNLEVDGETYEDLKQLSWLEEKSFSQLLADFVSKERDKSQQPVNIAVDPAKEGKDATVIMMQQPEPKNFGKHVRADKNQIKIVKRLDDVKPGFANRLRHVLHLKNMSAAELSRKSGLGHSTCHNLIRTKYKHNPCLGTIELLSKTLGCSIAYLKGHTLKTNITLENLERRSGI